MITPDKPNEEIERLDALVRYEILDTEPEKEYDDIAKVAAHVLDMPVAMVSFIDKTRKWYKAVVGIDSREMPREIAVCSHTIVFDQEIMIVEDTTKDIRFIDSPATKGKTPTIFYAGVKLVNSEGFVLGTICVIDHKPNSINDKQAEILIALGNQVIKLLEHRRNSILLSKINQQMANQYSELEKFTYAVAHDINSPISTMISLAQLMESQLEIDAETKSYTSRIKDAGYNLTQFVNNLLEYYKSDKVESMEKENISLHATIKKISGLLDPESKCQFQLKCHDVTIYVRAIVIDQILINLIKNSIKYCDKEQPIVSIDFSDNESFYQFTIEDNGIGIDPSDQNRIFDFMVTLNPKKLGSSGIGLSLVKKLIEKEGGTISVDSMLGKGSSFQFSIKK